MPQNIPQKQKALTYVHADCIYELGWEKQGQENHGANGETCDENGHLGFLSQSCLRITLNPDVFSAICTRGEIFDESLKAVEPPKLLGRAFTTNLDPSVIKNNTKLLKKLKCQEVDRNDCA